MSAFSQMKLTNNGKDLISRAMIGHEIEFTSIKMGDGNFSGNVGTLLDLVSTKQNLPIYNLRKYDTDRVLVGSVLLGSEVTVGFNWKEIGIFAKDKTLNDDVILFAYDNAGSESSYIPAGGSVIEQVINVELMMSNVENITATINESIVYLLKSNPDFTGTLTSSGKTLLKVDTEIEVGDATKNLKLKVNDKAYVETNGVKYEIKTEQTIVISNTQPTAIPGKTILWFHDEN